MAAGDLYQPEMTKTEFAEAVREAMPGAADTLVDREWLWWQSKLAEDQHENAPQTYSTPFIYQGAQYRVNRFYLNENGRRVQLPDTKRGARGVYASVGDREMSRIFKQEGYLLEKEPDVEPRTRNREDDN